MTTSNMISRYGLRCVLFVGLLMSLLVGCNQTLEEYQFTLEGTIESGQGAGESGTINVELYYQESGEGTLKQPLLLFQSFTLDAFGSFSQSIIYPVTSDRKGLIVYAWVDQNKDGSLCTTEQRDEGSALVVVEGFPKRTVNVKLKLENLCQGPEAFYP